jgi:anti-anti-sigma regulatory factor
MECGNTILVNYSRHDQEAGMAIRMEGTDVFLTGDWSIAGVVGHIDTLSDVLQQVDKKGNKTIKVDCGQIKSIDVNGLQILKVWLQCARFRGMEPKVVNLSEGLQRIMLVTGFAPSDAGLCVDVG